MCKKWIILLVIAFAFQLSWTAASASCQHEAEQSTQHFGHHLHQHQAVDDDEQKSKPGGKNPSSHPDCATCHHGSSMTADPYGIPLGANLRQDMRRYTPLQPPTPFLAEPERPKWLRAV